MLLVWVLNTLSSRKTTMKDLYLLIFGLFFIVMYLNNNHYLDFLCPKEWQCSKKESHG